MENIKETNIKNRTYYFFDVMIHIKEKHEKYEKSDSEYDAIQMIIYL